MTEAEAFNNLLILFSKLVFVSLLIPIVVALWHLKHLNKPLKIFLIYKALSFLFNLLVQLFVWSATKFYSALKPTLDYLNIKSTNFLEILFYLNDYIFLGWFFFLLVNRKHFGIWIWRIAMFLLIANIINYLFIEGHDVFGVFNPTSDAIFVFGVAAFYLWHLFRSQLVLPLGKNPYFWISFGLLLPQLIGLFHFMIGDVTQEENFPLFVTMSIVKNCFLILSQIFYAIAFWRARYAKYIALPDENTPPTSATV